MRYKKEQDKVFYQLLDAFKTVKPAEKDQLKAPSALGTGGGPRGSTVDEAQAKKDRQVSVKQLRKQKEIKAR